MNCRIPVEPDILNDSTVVQFFKDDSGNAVAKRYSWNYLQKYNCMTVYNYLKNRFQDLNGNESIREILYRIQKNIEYKPVCCVCGNPLKFGANGYSELYCSVKCKQIAWNDRFTDTMKSRYGVRTSFELDSVKQKRQDTWISKYGVDNPFAADSVKNKIKQTNIKKYGYEYPMQNSVIWEKSFRHRNPYHKNISMSKNEISIYNQLLKLFNEDDILRNYYDAERYPFHCDFYIKSIDLFIEVQGHFSHGAKPYNPSDPECISLVELWKSKITEENKHSNGYCHAIKIYTDKDVIKRNTALSNKLNFLELFGDLSEMTMTLNNYLKN